MVPLAELALVLRKCRIKLMVTGVSLTNYPARSERVGGLRKWRECLMTT